MIQGFDTDNPNAATGALLVYSVYRSRDARRLKVDTDLWVRVERFVKSSAKRAQSLSEFVERLKPRLGCEAIRPAKGGDGAPRDFLTGVLGRPDGDPFAVLRALYRETSLCVLLVRDRLEREKAARAAAAAEGNTAPDDLADLEFGDTDDLED